MPLGGIKPTVRISLLEEKPADYRCTIEDGVHSAMGNPQPGLTSAPAPGFPLPNAEIHLLDAGHFALDEKTDEIADLILQFMAKHPG